MSLDLERIIRFSVVAEEMSFSRAAERLRVDQSWLSRQIRLLEGNLGLRLFKRTTRQVALTEEGAAFLPEAAELRRLSERVRASALALRRGSSEHLRFGLASSLYWVPARHDLLKIFGEQNTRAALEVSSGSTPKLLHDLEQRAIDVALGSVDANEDKFESLVVYVGVPRILVPKEFALAQKQVIRMDDLAGYPIAVTDRAANPTTFDHLYQPLVAAGMRPRPVLEGRSAMAFYASTERLCLLSKSDADVMPPDDQSFVHRDIEDVPMTLVAKVYRNRGDDRPLVRRIWTIARKLGADMR